MAITRIPLALIPLTLMGCATVVPSTAPSSDELTGTSWHLETLDGQSAKSPMAGLSFAADRISATAGCNGVGGAWKLAGDRIVADRFISTMMYCEGLMEQERALTQLFEAGPQYVITADRLTMEGGNHRAVLRRKR